tara:strand:+ start:2653 stop:2868 length:216 start_codon:yes stop_codon:yes gene_type:complete
MGLFNWFRQNEGPEHHQKGNNNIVVKTLTSKGVGKLPVALTVGDIKRGFAVDSNGYSSEVVIFLRKNKKDR